MKPRLLTIGRSSIVLRIAFGLLAAAVLCPGSMAQQSSPGLPAAIERYLDSRTAIVGWSDISEIDLDELAEFGRKLRGSGLVGKSATDETKAIQQALTQLGVTRIYWISDLSGLTTGPQAAIVPSNSENVAAVALILSAVAAKAGGTANVNGDAVLVGQADAMARLQVERNGEPNHELLAAVNRVSDPHGLVLMTPVAAMMPFAGMLPTLTGGDAAQAAKAAEVLVNLKSVTLSGELPPSKARLRVTAKSAEAAGDLVSLVNEWTSGRLGEDATVVQFAADGDSAVLTTTSIDQTLAVIGAAQRLKSGHSRPATMNSMKQIGLAMHNFHDVYAHFPPQSLTDENGKRLLSWRVLILPYLDAMPLYQQFQLDEPWDSEHNRKLIEKMPDVFLSRSVVGEELETGKTRFVAPLTDNSIFGRPGPGVAIQDITDGTSNTILVLEAGPENAVVWTKPEDLPINLQTPLRSIIDADAEGFTTVFGDGSARFFANGFDTATLRALLSMNGGEIVDYDKLK